MNIPLSQLLPNGQMLPVVSVVPALPIVSPSGLQRWLKPNPELQTKTMDEIIFDTEFIPDSPPGDPEYQDS